MADEFCVVFVTMPAREDAENIASCLVSEDLAACCNLIPNVWSIYHWKGRVERNEEVLLVIKARRADFDQLCARVTELHSYEVPEVIALPIVAGHQPYLDWMREETER